MTLREITVLSVILRVFLAVLLGGILGLERGMKNRPAGLRTYMLVCMGSCVIMLTNLYFFQASQAGDPMRLGAQVVSGIGFLGAGTIVVTRRNHIKGLTTAAGLWATAGVGLALGTGFYEAAITAGILIFFTLTVLQKWDHLMHSKTKTMDLYIEIGDQLSIGNLIRSLREMDLEIEDMQLDRDTALEEHVRGILLTLKSPKRRDHNDLLMQVQQISGILMIEEL